MKQIEDMKRSEFEALPSRNWNEDIGEFDSLIILPKRHLHDSGYRCMDFVAVRDFKPVCRLSGCSDVIHIEGIGGLGYRWLERFGEYPKSVKPIGWSIDCLRTSGLLRLFTGRKMLAGEALSSFEVFSKPNWDSPQ